MWDVRELRLADLWPLPLAADAIAQQAGRCYGVRYNVQSRIP